MNDDYKRHEDGMEHETLSSGGSHDMFSFSHVTLCYLHLKDVEGLLVLNGGVGSIQYIDFILSHVRISTNALMLCDIGLGLVGGLGRSSSLS